MAKEFHQIFINFQARVPKEQDPRYSGLNLDPKIGKNLQNKNDSHGTFFVETGLFDQILK